MRFYLLLSVLLLNIVDQKISAQTPCVPPTLANGVISSCDEGDGTSTFNLTSTEADINPFDPGLPLTWYEDADFQNEVTGDLSNYSSGVTTLYAVVGEPGCTSVATLQLQLGAVSLQDQTVQKCATNGDNTAFFDLTLIENDMIEDAEDMMFNWFEDNLLSVAITANLDNYESAGNEVIYASVEDAQGCKSVGLVTLEVGEVEANSTTIELCAGIDGTIDVDFSDYRDSINSSSIYTVTWYTNAELTSEVVDITNVTVNDGDVFYALVDNGNVSGNDCQSAEAIVTFDLSAPPTLFSGVNSNCDEGDGTSTFNLTSTEADINPFDPGLPLTWYEDADFQNEVTGDLSNYSSGVTTLYAVVGEPGCTSVAGLSLTVESIDVNDIEINVCQDIIDLAVYESDIYAGSQNSFSWYNNSNQTEVISTPTNFAISGNQIVYCLVSLEGNCDGLAELKINYCQDSSEDTLILDTVEVDTISDVVYTYIDIINNFYDTVTYFDSNFVNIYDTLIVYDIHDIYDTIRITVEDTLVINMMNDNSSGIEEGLTNLVKVYPNPTSSQLNVNFQLPGNYTVSLTNINGQMVFTQANVMSNIQIDISEFTKGLYFITIRDNDGVLKAEERKIVIK